MGYSFCLTPFRDIATVIDHKTLMVAPFHSLMRFLTAYVMVKDKGPGLMHSHRVVTAPPFIDSRHFLFPGSGGIYRKP